MAASRQKFRGRFPRFQTVIADGIGQQVEERKDRSFRGNIQAGRESNQSRCLKRKVEKAVHLLRRQSMKIINGGLTLLLHMLADEGVGLILRAEALSLEQLSQTIQW